VRAKTRPILAAFLTLLAAVASVASPAHAVRGGVPQWTPCPEDKTAQCATLSVPVDWAQPYGPTVAIALARRPAADPQNRIGTLVVNPGGPGGSGVDFTLDSTSFFSAELRKRFDIVGFDPRGVSRSHPIVCTTTVLTAAPPPAIDSAAAYDTVVAYNRRLAADCAARTPSTSTASSAPRPRRPRTRSTSSSPGARAAPNARCTARTCGNSGPACSPPPGAARCGTRTTRRTG
jgi:pimeloyl-ACP methyl ester carboxylesterase